MRQQAQRPQLKRDPLGRGIIAIAIVKTIQDIQADLAAVATELRTETGAAATRIDS